jgi:hypothetical protein
MLKQQIKQDSVEAMKSGDQFKTGVLRMLLAAVTVKEKDRRYKISKDKPDATEYALVKESELGNEQIIEVLSSEIKKRKDAIVLYEKGNRPELAKGEQEEIEILKKYLPEQMSREEIQKLIEESIKKTGAKEMKDMGKVMADLNQKIKGKADSGEISKIVKELLIK